VSARTRWITFDCYGTLVDWEAGFATVLAPLVGDKSADVLRAYHAHERIVEHDEPQRSYRHVLITSLMRAAADHGVALSRAEARRLPEAWSFLRPFDEVEAMLAELRRRGYRLAVLTNCDEDLFEVTHRMFRAPFDFALTSERVRGYKPSPWHFRGFERLTGVSRSDWVHVAASRYHDIEPAQSMGIQHVWLDRERSGQPSPLRVQSTSGVVAAVDRLFAGGSPAAAGRTELRVCC
jgi:2-haloacid dehalogenase